MLCLGPTDGETPCPHGRMHPHTVIAAAPSRPPGWGTVAPMPRAASREPVTPFIPPPRPMSRPLSCDERQAIDPEFRCEPSTPLHVNVLAYLGSAGIVVGLSYLAIRAVS